MVPRDPSSPLCSPQGDTLGAAVREKHRAYSAIASQTPLLLASQCRILKLELLFRSTE